MWQHIVVPTDATYIKGILATPPKATPHKK